MRDEAALEQTNQTAHSIILNQSVWIPSIAHFESLCKKT
jgi:hypothetical protein